MAKDQLDQVADDAALAAFEGGDVKAQAAFVLSLFDSGEIRSGVRFANAPVDPVEAARSISAQRRAATSLADLLEGKKLTSGKDYVGKTFQVASVEWRASDIEGDGCPIYAIYHAVTPDGEAVTLGCGAWSVVETTAIAVANDFFTADQWVKFVSIPLDNGRTAVELHIAEGPFAR